MGLEEDLASGAPAATLVPGDVDGLTLVAQTLRRHAEVLELAGSALSRVEVTNWRGRAAQGFTDVLAPEPGRWRGAADAFVAGAAALEGFCHALGPARVEACEAADTYRQYLTAVATAVALVGTDSPTGLSDRMQVGARIGALQGAVAAGGPAAGVATEAERLRRQAIALLDHARTAVSGAGDVAAEALGRAMAAAPTARRFYEPTIRPAGAEGAAHLLLDGVSLVPGWVGVGAAGINALWYASEGRGADAALSMAGAVPIGKGLGALGGVEVVDGAAVLRGWPAKPDPALVGHAPRHIAPWTWVGKSQFFDGVDVAALSDTSTALGFVQDNGNLRFLLNAHQDIGVDVMTGLPTSLYTVIRRPNGEGVTMYPGASDLS